MAIHDANDEEAAQAYKLYFKKTYTNKITNGEWAKSSVGEFATALQVWQGNKSNFYCTHFKANNEEDVYKQLEAWCVTKFFTSMVIETDRFTSALLP